MEGSVVSSPSGPGEDGEVGEAGKAGKAGCLQPGASVPAAPEALGPWDLGVPHPSCPDRGLPFRPADSEAIKYTASTQLAINWRPELD